MASLHLIVGMAGSGKTRHCKNLATKIGARFYSDFTLVHMCQEDERAGHNKLPELVARVLSGFNCVADEPHLTNPSFRNEFRRFLDLYVAPQVNIEWSYFEKNVRACAANVINDWRGGRQNRARVEALINQIKVYTVPEGEKGIIPCYNPGHTFDSDNAAIEALRALLL